MDPISKGSRHIHGHDMLQQNHEKLHRTSKKTLNSPGKQRRRDGGDLKAALCSLRMAACWW